MADFTISPGIVTNEIDQSIRSTPVTTGSVAGVIGEYNWGPAMIPTIIKDEETLFDEFGGPTSNNYMEWFNGKNFLDYATDLSVVRVVDTNTAKNATFSGTTVYSPNRDFYTDQLVTTENGQRDPDVPASSTDPSFGVEQQYGGWIALYPGKQGNNIRVEMCFATEREEKMGLRDAANTANNQTINCLELTKIYDDDYPGVDNRFTIDFKHDDSSSPPIPINFMDTGVGYFESRNDILAGAASINQEKVITFVHDSKTYNMLLESTSASSATGYVNEGDGTVPLANNVSMMFNSDPIEITIRERSKFEEFSVGASINNKDNLLGKIYCDLNQTTVYGKGTAFTRQVCKGDVIRINSVNYVIAKVTSDVQLSIESTNPIQERVNESSPATWQRRWRFASSFNSEPSTSAYVRSLSGYEREGNYNDQMHMVVINVDVDEGAAVESYGYLSLAKDGRNDNKVPNYYVDQVNAGSNWIRWANHIIKDIRSDGNWGKKLQDPDNPEIVKFHCFNKNGSQATGDSSVAKTLKGGMNGNSVKDADIVAAVNLYKAKELYEVDFFLVGWTNKEIDYQVISSKMIQVAEERKDCVVCITAEYHKTIQGRADSKQMTLALVDWRNGVIDSSYGFMVGNFKRQIDSYNKVQRWVPFSGDIAGLMARCDTEFQPWYSPAGFRRGSIKNVFKLAFNPNQEERDLLYTAQINPIFTARPEGTVLYGDKTLQRIASAFDRINVRRLFITVKDFVVRQARLRLFEFNTPLTRETFRKQIETQLEFVRSEQGLSDFRVICDETNNPATIIEQNRFVADIYIKPTYVINFIKLNFTAVGQSVEFEDLGV